MAHMKRYGHQFNEHISNVMTLFKMGVPVPFEVSWSDLDLDHVHQRSCFYGNLFWEIIVLSQNFWPISHKWSVMYMVGNLWISAFLQNLKETIFLILWSGQNCALILAVCQIYEQICIWANIYGKYMGKFIHGKYVERCASITTGGCYQWLQIYGPTLAPAHPSLTLKWSKPCCWESVLNAPNYFQAFSGHQTCCFCKLGTYGLAERRLRKRVHTKALTLVRNGRSQP